MLKLLDLYCGAGGAAMGYHLAGIDEIVGIDSQPQPRFPFDFIQDDAIKFLARHGEEFDLIHASPPCQLYSKTHRIMHGNHPDLIERTRDILLEIGKPFIIGIEKTDPVGGGLCDSKIAGRAHPSVFRIEIFYSGPVGFKCLDGVVGGAVINDDNFRILSRLG